VDHERTGRESPCISKFYDKRNVHHEEAVHFVAQVVLNTGSAWNPHHYEAGIDGMVELGDLRTGAATGAFLGVQVKTKERLDAESETQFGYYADADDPDYDRSRTLLCPW
jgi:hypothetical protein